LLLNRRNDTHNAFTREKSARRRRPAQVCADLHASRPPRLALQDLAASAAVVNTTRYLPV